MTDEQNQDTLAALPSNAGLERIAFDKWFADGGEDEYDRQFYWQIWRDSARAEREACANVADEFKVKGLRTVVDAVADAIRLRSNLNSTTPNVAIKPRDVG